MIFLTGMPGAGKSYWGREIANARGWRFYDLDIFIEQQEKVSIAAIFESKGEAYFRGKEHYYLVQIITSAPPYSVVACGGGTPCFHSNMDLMKSAGKAIYLKATIDYLINNLSKDTAKRPLLKAQADVKSYLEELLSNRAVFYEKATDILQSENISLATFEQIID